MENLFALAHACLICPDPAEKTRLTQAASDHLRKNADKAGRSNLLDPDGFAAPQPIPIPGRPELPHLVSPRELPQRKLTTPAGRAALIHAVAHIEFNAINLAWDAVYRFRDMPAAYYADWVGVAADEARHFLMLRDRLRSLGHEYGDFDAHNGLWEMALKTADDCLARMALVPRVLEARGLDVTPGMIERLRAARDLDTVAILETILSEEVAHVAAGSRWFVHCCALRGLGPDATFRRLLADHGAVVRPPFNEPARLAAGFSAAELSGIAGMQRPPPS